MVGLTPCAFAAAEQFLTNFQTSFAVPGVIEARHATWFNNQASEVLHRCGVGRVHADPPAVSVPVEDTAPIKYYRMHGSPRTYYSPYETAALTAFARQLTGAALDGVPSWCIFDNTALGHATVDALALQQML